MTTPHTSRRATTDRRKPSKTSDHRFYALLVFATITIAMTLGTIQEIIK